MSRIDIVLIRHGWSEGNEKRLLYGRLDVPLTEEGIEKLRESREMYDYPETDRYYSSPLLRARQTFETIYPDKKLDGILDGFVEMSFGDVEGYPESYADGYKSYFKRWSAGETLWNGENMASIRMRTDKAMKDLVDSLYREGLESATVVCHSCTIKSILMNIGYMNEDFMSVFVPQGMGFRVSVEYDGKNMHVISCTATPAEIESRIIC